MALLELLAAAARTRLVAPGCGGRALDHRPERDLGRRRIRSPRFERLQRGADQVRARRRERPPEHHRFGGDGTVIVSHQGRFAHRAAEIGEHGADVRSPRDVPPPRESLDLECDARSQRGPVEEQRGVQRQRTQRRAHDVIRELPALHELEQPQGAVALSHPDQTDREGGILVRIDQGEHLGGDRIPRRAGEHAGDRVVVVERGDRRLDMRQIAVLGSSREVLHEAARQRGRAAWSWLVRRYQVGHRATRGTRIKTFPRGPPRRSLRGRRSRPR